MYGEEGRCKFVSRGLLVLVTGCSEYDFVFIALTVVLLVLCCAAAASSAGLKSRFLVQPRQSEWMAGGNWIREKDREGCSFVVEWNMNNAHYRW